MGLDRDKYLEIKKPIVSHEVAEFIESTRGQDALDVVIEIEMMTTDKQAVGVSQEVASFVIDCFDSFVVARNYGYRVG